MRVQEQEFTMKVTRVVCALALSLTGGVGVATSAWAAPSSALTYTLTDCTGLPPGTPTTFDATKQPSGAAALHLTDGSGVFVLMQAIDTVTGATLFSTPGFENHFPLKVTCTLDRHTAGNLLSVTGLMTPVG
jgi:hypothetical protein